MTEYKECRHIMPSGLHCKSPAMRGSVFCYFHGRPPRPAPPVRPLETRIDIPPVLNPNSALKAVGTIIQALGANRISTRRAGLPLFGVQMAAGQQGFGSAGAGPADRNALVEALLEPPPRNPLALKH